MYGLILFHGIPNSYSNLNYFPTCRSDDIPMFFHVSWRQKSPGAGSIPIMGKKPKQVTLPGAYQGFGGRNRLQPPYA